MRRLVLVLFALALLCQGAFAAVSPDCRLGNCCGMAVEPVDVAAALPAEDDAHAPCDAAAMAAPCEDGTCQCHGPALTALLALLPEWTASGPEPAAAAAPARLVTQHVPDGLLRPPHLASR